MALREVEIADTMESDREPNSSDVLLQAIDGAERAFQSYMAYCKIVDRAYSLTQELGSLDTNDEAFALFWASMEILKPAIYAKPPVPVATPRFKDGGSVERTTAELMERCLISEFSRGGIDDVMIGVRDDLALTNRGVAWVTYESEDGQKVCFEDLDRTDFLHEPARKWREVGWVARRAWMTKKQMKDRFSETSGDAYERANFHDRKDKAEYGETDSSAKAGVWEVWSKVDNKVYWVSEGVNVILDEDEPHLNLKGFFPCPRPAYGTLARRSLVPVPDYKRYVYHLDQINELTQRIYALLERVKLKVLVPGGGEIGDAVQTALTSEDDSIVIPVPAAALMTQGAGNLMVTLPLVEIAQTIQGLIEARGQMIEDFYQLSGISDIMRGATEAQETLGAQQLKTQYGSVRVRDKIDELTRLSRDIAEIAAEIMAQNFSQKTLLEMARMTIPTKAEVKAKLDETKEAAEKALNALKAEVEEAAAEMEQMPPDQRPDPAQAEQQFAQKQQEIIAQFQPIIRELGEAVVIEDVMEMLRDNKARNLIIDIETDSTILTDENAEKQSRGEFLSAFSNASQSVMMLMQAGEPGAKLAGGIIKFALQPFRANRELDALVDEFTDNAAQLAQSLGGEGDGENEALAAANMKLAEAEGVKAQAALLNVQAKAAKDQAENERKMAEIVQKAENDKAKLMAEAEKLRQSAEANTIKAEEALAKVDLLRAQTMKALNEAGVVVSSQQLDEFKSLADIELRKNEQALSVVDRQTQAVESERNAEMSERQQSFSEQQGERQLTMAERQAMQEPAE